MLSRNITRIYVIQYIAIIYLYEFIAKEEGELGLVLTLLLSAAIFKAAENISNSRIALPDFIRKTAYRY